MCRQLARRTIAPVRETSAASVSCRSGSDKRCYTLLESRHLLVHTSQKPGQLDHDALMGSRANDFRIVPALDFELKLPALHRNEFYLSHNIHPNRRRRDVTNVDVSSDGALTRRQMRTQGFDARPFDISNHESGRKDRWHIPKAAERRGYGRNDQ